ncbi:hypothetical protein RJ641_032382 [Dillenia turbinata]|uniref:Uncharacterized protein n=1 Tax=Dillenia turbinata TaxID=194707 RepID=A0AAN8VRS2_9MAGN
MQCRRCVIAREMTKVHEEVSLEPTLINFQVAYISAVKLETIYIYGALIASFRDRDSIVDEVINTFWRRTIGEAKEAFLDHQPKGEITLLIEGKAPGVVDRPSESEIENELGDLISSGHSLSMAVKLVAEGTSMRKKIIYLHCENLGSNLKLRMIPAKPQKQRWVEWCNLVSGMKSILCILLVRFVASSVNLQVMEIHEGEEEIIHLAFSFDGLLIHLAFSFDGLLA